MAAPYKIWLLGTDTYYQPGSMTVNQTLVGTGAGTPPTHLPEVSATYGWIEIPIYAMDFDANNEGEEYEAPGGSTHKRINAVATFAIKTGEYIFPDEFEQYYKIKKAITKRYHYLANTGDYPIIFSGLAGAIAVLIQDGAVEHNHANGTKSMTLNGRLLLPDVEL